jgi:curved DNA-binding protein CbpA
MPHESPEPDWYEVLQVHPRAHAAVITAAYRALARMLHPDSAGEHTHAPMARLNRAYGILRAPESRRTYDRERAAGVAVTMRPGPETRAAVPSPPVRPGTGRRGMVLSYGRYAGWALEDLVRQDSDYLRWLLRHPSGRQFRAEIERLLTPRPVSTPLYRR